MRVLEPVTIKKENECHRTKQKILSCLGDVAELQSVAITTIAKTDQDVCGDTECKDQPSMAVNFDLGTVSERLALLERGGGALTEKETDKGDGGGRSFRAKINPSSNSQAEEELRKQIR